MTAAMFDASDRSAPARAKAMPSGVAPVRSASRNILSTNAFLIEHWSEMDAQPRVVLGDDLQVLWSNAAADEVLAAGDDVTLSTGAFKLTNASEMVAFRRFLSEGHKPGAWCSTDGEGGSTVFLAELVKLNGVVVTGLVFRAADKRYQPQWADFSRVFGLTAMEFKVARRLLDGLQIESIANELKIAVGTARIHVRNLYGKLDVSSREAMFRLLLPYHIR